MRGTKGNDDKSMRQKRFSKTKNRIKFKALTPSKSHTDHRDTN